VKASVGRMRRIEKARDKAQKRRLVKMIKATKEHAALQWHYASELHDLIHKHDPIYQRMQRNKSL